MLSVDICTINGNNYSIKRYNVHSSYFLYKNDEIIMPILRVEYTHWWKGKQVKYRPHTSTNNLDTDELIALEDAISYLNESEES